MPLHLIACLAGGPSSDVLLTRLLLSAGYSTDELAQDLRTNFMDTGKAVQLCRPELPLRGLPSVGVMITVAEQALLPTVAKEIANYADLVEETDNAEAVSVHVFSDGTWRRVHDEFNQVDLRELRLFQVKTS